MLNPDQKPFCLAAARSPVILPLRVNQTSPILLELLRIDLDANLNETISIKGKELRKLVRQAKKALPASTHSSPWLIELPVKDQGLYRLQKVVDESKLEVRRRPSDALVVQCPSALVKTAPRHKCKGDLSDFFLEVKATPPFKVKYRKTVNTEENHVVLSIHPDNKVSTLEPADTIGSFSLNDQVNSDFSWARTQTVTVPLNESMGIAGSWQYLVDEVHDAVGNFVNYSSPNNEGSSFKLKGESRPEQVFDVHERPKASLDGHSSQRPLKLPHGKAGFLPVWLTSTEADEPESSRHELTYSFVPQEQTEGAVLRQVEIRGKKTGFQVSEPGLYTLKAVSSEYCVGEILEPSSCLLQNPQNPDMTFTAENIPDTCAGNSIGLLVDLHLIGTPPFRISYISRREDYESIQNTIDTNSLQKRLELRPTQAGHHTYEFLQISDAIYKDPRSLATKNLVLEQDVKPPASAWFRYGRPKKSCIDEPVSFDVEFSGEGPWNLEYEIAHNGQRKKMEVKDILESACEITTDALRSGGDYSLILTSVTDNSGCKALLEHERKIEVSFQKPKVSFGHLDDKRSILALEGRDISLPLRLQGKPPWTVSYRNLALPEAKEMEVVIHQNNDQLMVNNEGTYEIVSLRDASCPGFVDASQSKFNVQWIPKPGLKVVQSSLLQNISGRFIKKGVCEGDEDATDIAFTGTAPYTVEYNLKKSKPHRGLHSMRTQKLTAGFTRAAFKMETSEPGLYEYEFSKLGDGSYSHSASTSSVLTVQQEVYSRPSACFTDVGKTYKYCKEEEMGDEVIPITFTGLPPFHLEIEIRHHANTKPETVEIPHINERQYDFRIPHRLLAIGTHAVTLRKVSDAHNCQKKMDFDAPFVHVSVADTPTITSLEEQTDFCVGDRISYTLSGTPPFKVFYTFQNIERKASITTTTFKRIAEKPGEFKIIAISDQRSTENCKAKTDSTKIIHEMPSVRISKGKTSIVDIHEGGEAEIFFEFGGTPPFQFTLVKFYSSTICAVCIADQSAFIATSEAPIPRAKGKGPRFSKLRAISRTSTQRRFGLRMMEYMRLYLSRISTVRFRSTSLRVNLGRNY